MKIAVIGAAGKAGSLIVKEAKERGHQVTALVRDPSKFGEEGVQAVQKDVFELTGEDVKGYDAVVNAISMPPGREDGHIEAGRKLIEAFQSAPDTRLIVVGGAGSLFVDEAQTTRLIETPDFPDLYKPTASSQGQNLKDLEASSGIKWTFLSPAAFFDAEGKRTGAYRAAGDVLTVNAAGDSYISYEDYAIAIVDEIEKSEHVNERFSVVGEKE
ncbi:NAD(P)-dependent oxidoreductase [Saccharibacillus sp. CPCC 101409]|uniref:NAD(P)-dependent oxidoreductase n=1 Tax=Saccharibacillus sp. CPCC 101409 TaxID=3058041 RepID=UPI0026713B53|nr:NAD(P)-dependent oxidoreductase [Saccharibacillus sp. CPCC 101409]MDO3408605.1 NAD(P)-dependent oxidoreductase [Saccharibacillus sp. CPCC 101409]